MSGLLAVGAIGLSVLLCGALPGIAMAAGQTVVEGGRLSSEQAQTRLVFDLAAPLAHKVFTLSDPDRVVVDLRDARLLGNLPLADGSEPLVTGVRSGERNDSDLRIVVDLRQPARVKSFLLPPNETYGHRLVLDLTPKGAAVQLAGPGAEPTAVPISEPISEQAMIARLDATANPDGLLSVQPKTPPAAVGMRDLVIAIDAGHGGQDPGAIGPAGTREKDITLAVARKLAARVNKQPGLRAVLVRDADIFIPLRQRIVIARKARADLFVSIHADAFNDRSVRGSSVFTLSHGGATSEAARWLAERENSADQVGGIVLQDHDGVLASVLLDMTQNATIEHSSIAATKVLARLQTLGNVHQQRIQQAGFAVLKSPDVPSMLVEAAFISNPDEEKRLRSGRFQDRLADAILDGIIDYFTAYPPPDTRFARKGANAGSSAREHRIASGDTLSGIAASYNVPLHRLRSANQLRDDRLQVGQVLVIPEG